LRPLAAAAGSRKSARLARARGAGWTEHGKRRCSPRGTNKEYCSKGVEEAKRISVREFLKERYFYPVLYGIFVKNQSLIELYLLIRFSQLFYFAIILSSLF
jgi:hypothetical protein